ncbi:MAG: DUF2924 domain-containing protein [Lentisphaerae bacterium]|nr:DUF2924 domain-containing protein [Lentisphaerota bacterium]
MVDSGIVTRQLAALQNMDLGELQEKFAELYGTPTACFNLQQIRRRLAYRIQEIYFGGLTKSEKDILTHIGSKDATARMEKRKPDNLENIKGTRFQRQWKGRLYEVIALGEGTFEYDGRIFKSLSAVANAITGTRWNGKLFFGVSSTRTVK